MDTDALPKDVLLGALLATMESAHLGCTVMTSRDGTLSRTYSNEPVARILGMTVEEFQHTPPFLVLTTDEKERVTRMREDASPPPNLETKITRPDGTVVPIEVSLASVPLGEAEDRVIVAFLRDLTPRVAMEAALRESEERFRSISEIAPDSITMVAGDRYVYANPVARRLLGVTTDEELARLDPIATAPKDRREEILARRSRLLAGDINAPIELHIKVEGRDVFLEVSSRLTTFAGQPAIVSYARDITDRKELQARLMQQDRLAAVGTLAAGLAHELNNPLTYLAFHLKRLRDRALARPYGEESETIAQIEEGTKRMQAVISDLLFLTRDNDRPLAHVDVRQVILSTLSLVNAGAKNSTRITSELPSTRNIFGHPSRLGQVFLNLILNALEAVSARDNGHVRVQLRELDLWIEVVIIDNGHGVSPESRPRVFDPFYTTKPEGSGLGLSISRSIVTSHGGEISMESSDNGAVVTVRLPISTG